MAEALARRLMSEIHVETLDSLFTSFRALYPSEPRPTNIPELDSIINNTLFPPERDPLRDGSPAPAAEAARVSAQATTTAISKKTKDQPLSIEIISQQPFTGRTQLTLHLTAQSLLGSLEHEASTIVWIDLDRRLSIPRLHKLLLSELRSRWPPTPSPSSPTPDPSSQLPPNNDPTPEELSAAEEALGHLHVFRPTSFSSLLATLVAVPGTMLDTTAHLSGMRILSHVIVSGVTAFHWNERARLEGARVEGGGTTAAGGSISDRYQSLVLVLKDIQKTLHCHVVCSRVGGTVRLPRAWDEWVDVGLVLDKVKGRLPPGVGVREAAEMEWPESRLVGKLVVGGEEQMKFGLNVREGGVAVREIDPD